MITGSMHNISLPLQLRNCGRLELIMLCRSYCGAGSHSSIKKCFVLVIVQRSSPTMPTQSMDEEKALLQAYHDEELRLFEQPSHYPNDEQVDDSPQRASCRKKKVRAIFKHLAVFSLLLLGWNVLQAYRAGRMSCGQWRNYGGIEKSDTWDFNGLDESVQHPPQDFPWPPQVTLEECVEWPAPSPPGDGEYHGGPGNHHPSPHSFDSSFNLPSSADILAFFARGPLSVGSFNVEQGTEETDQVVVDVTTKWHGPRELLDLVQLCRFKGEKGSVGVGIVSVKGGPHHRPHHRHRVWFEVNVRLPPGSDKPLEIKKFLTFLPVFSQTVSDLGKSVYFGGIGLKGFVSGIKINSLSAKNAYINAGVGAIKGNFTTSSSLELITSSGEIDVDVGLTNDEKSDKWTDLLLATSTGAIKANLSLHTESDSNVGGKFNITSGFSAGSVILNTIVAPKDSTVDLTAHGSVGAIHVTMDKTFEGKFDVGTSVLSRPTIVERKEKDEDGRERKFEYSQVGRGVVQGNVWWDADDGNTDGKERGNVEIRNSLGHVSLTL
ncbi:hypothetical protein E1B28_013602 [Marasmius oreades]|uniref:Uncharacterized protein n=1 Tax=Marasmius oreades TaxID=181124 RepID=A0A9P7RQ52_9AGAR|nr:uncharacterized protein E1B28_013602 [Marasmius oreades]KAG7087654.1 hypothetical protein E1B28_013602 [Marasmius oreades]